MTEAPICVKNWKYSLHSEYDMYEKSFSKLDESLPVKFNDRDDIILYRD
jgi:hypothetical protein